MGEQERGRGGSAVGESHSRQRRRRMREAVQLAKVWDRGEMGGNGRKVDVSSRWVELVGSERRRRPDVGWRMVVWRGRDGGKNGRRFVLRNRCSLDPGVMRLLRRWIAEVSGLSVVVENKV